MVGEPLGRLGEHCDLRKALIVTDRNVRTLFGDRFPPCTIVEVEPGEAHKTLETVGNIYDEFLRLELDRSSFVVGIGGGLVCDVAGFAASTYLRGLSFGFVPTTLLAQVDASVGGKNGVNFHGYKNLIGTFNQPSFVICDLEMIGTLPLEDVRNGMAEIVKHALIGNSGLFSYLEQNKERLLSLESGPMEKVVYESLLIKARIVSRDETERGERRKLNLGHTFGHAVEKHTGMPHGEAVSIGMVVAARLSTMRGTLKDKEAERVMTLLSDLGLPTRFTGDKHAILDGVRKDKKREDQVIHMALLGGIGHAIIEPVAIEELEEVFDDLR